MSASPVPRPPDVERARRNKREFLAGALCIAVFLAATTALVLHRTRVFSGGERRVEALFDQVGDLAAGAHVTRNGLRIGAVESIRPLDREGVLVTVRIDERVDLPVDVEAEVALHDGKDPTLDLRGGGSALALEREGVVRLPRRGRLADRGSRVAAEAVQAMEEGEISPEQRALLERAVRMAKEAGDGLRQEDAAPGVIRAP